MTYEYCSVTLHVKLLNYYIITILVLTSQLNHHKCNLIFSKFNSLIVFIPFLKIKSHNTFKINVVIPKCFIEKYLNFFFLIYFNIIFNIKKLDSLNNINKLAILFLSFNFKNVT